MELKLFALNGSKKYAQSVSDWLELPLAVHEEKHFDDGESYIKSDTNVRNSDVYIIHSFYSDGLQKIDEKFANLLFFIGSLKDASAQRISIVSPYFGYSRQDRKDRSRAPITTKYIAIHLEAAGAHRLLTMDVHNKSALDNAFRIPTDNLEWKKLLVDYLCGGVDMDGFFVKNHIDEPLCKNPENLAVLSPDIGGMERAEQLRVLLEQRLKVNVEPAIFNKRRINGNVTGKRIIGDVKDKRVILIDDIIASGSTVKLASETVESMGGKMFAVCATHGLFSGEAVNNLANMKRIIISDSISTNHLADTFKSKLNVVETTEMISKAIRITNEGGSISKLLS